MLQRKKLNMENNENKYYCKICEKDLSGPVKMFGITAWEYHSQLHINNKLIKEILRSHNFIKQLYEENTYYEKQLIKDFFAAIPEEIKIIIQEGK
jgi:hypothetical protein